MTTKDITERDTTEQQVPISKKPDLLYGGLERALHTNEYEVVEKAREEVIGLRAWRAAAKSSPFPEIYGLFEAATRFNGAEGLSDEEKRTTKHEISDSLLPLARSMSPRIRDLYIGLLSEFEGVSPTPQFPMTQDQIQILKESGDLSVLQSPYVPWNIKLNRIQTRVEKELLGRKALDKKDKESVGEEELKPTHQEDAFPPPETDESKPSMDETERLKEGEQASAVWTITPAYGGYYKQQSFDTWDPSQNVWKQSRYVYESISLPGQDNAEGNIVISAQIRSGQRTRVPVPYTHNVISAQQKGATARSSNLKIDRDQNSDYTILIVQEGRGEKVQPVAITLAKADYQLPFGESKGVPNMPSTLSAETMKVLEQIKAERYDNLSRARGLRTFLMRHLTYSNDSSYNALYENYPDGYFAAIDKFKKADCDVANTYFAALCASLGIPVRHVVGHMVKGKDASGNSRITRGTGHAWSEVWDGKGNWVRIDATPPGDPQQDKEDQRGGEHTPGDYGEAEEAIMPTDEKLKELEEKLSNLAESLSYTVEERSLAEATGVSPKEARQIISEIDKAEQTRLPNGERVVDVMSQLFSLIIESRKVAAPSYSGPVRKREGGEEIEDIISHKIGVMAGDNDPASRRKEEIQVENQLVFDGLDTYIIGDKSGSMGQTANGEEKWRLQRRAEYLVFSSLYRFQQNLQRLQNRMTSPLSVRTEAISFKGSGENDIDVDKPLSNVFSPQDKVKLWKSLGNQGTGNGDVPALQIVYDGIKKERDESGQENDKRLRVIMACSDGMPDNPAGVRQMAEEIGKLNSVVVGIGLTETATQVPIIFKTEFSRGDIARNLNDLPAIVAKHIVMEAARLFPERTRPLYQKQIEQVLAKFERIGVV